jgi:predicted enzyme related to lactoylglutathione lyase
MATNNSENDRRIDYVEFDVADMARAKKFYGDVFGWTFKDYGPGYCEFRDGRLTGGFAGAGKARGAGGPLVILYANDLSDIQRRIEAAGGRIVTVPYYLPGGRRFHFADPYGYDLAVWTAR